jgi:hypothetical protein
MVLIPLVLDNDFEIIKDEIPTMPVTENAQINWFQYFGTIVHLEKESYKAVIATLIIPVNDQQEAEVIVKSAEIHRTSQEQIEISIKKDSDVYKWLFAKNTDGYVFINKDQK